MKNRKDIFLLLVTILHMLFWATLAVFYSSWPVKLGASLGIIFLICTQFQTVAHYHIHRPLFKNPTLNQLFAMVLSPLLGVPFGLYYAHHMNHHRFNNGPGDRSSTRRYGINNEESFLKYSLLSPLRTDLVTLWKEAKQARGQSTLLLESISLLAVFLFFFIHSFEFGALSLILVYLGQALAAAENYQEHRGADPTLKGANSVSAYSQWYNFIWFNNGYHQEHHFVPTKHWTELPEITNELAPIDERPTTQGSHWSYRFLSP